MKRKLGRKKNRRDGCAFLVLTCIFTCFFLVLNSALVSGFYPWMAEVGPSFLRLGRVEQIIYFTAPVAMLFLEWWIVDLLVDLLSPAPRTKHEPRAGRR